MIVRFAFAMIFLSFSTFSQAQNNDSLVLRCGGTLIIGAKATDGIVIAADSRMITTTNQPNESPRIASYTDNFQKLFIVNNYVVAGGGLAYFGDKSLKVIIEEFTSSYNKNESPLLFLKAFYDFLQTKYPQVASYYKYSDGHEVLYCFGYYNGIAFVINLLRDKFTDNVFFNPAGKYFSYKYNPTFSCDQIFQIEKAAIDLQSKDAANNMAIGGNVSGIKIAKGEKPKWISDPSKFTYYNYWTDFIKDYLARKTKTIIVDASSDALIRAKYQALINDKKQKHSR